MIKDEKALRGRPARGSRVGGAAAEATLACYRLPSRERAWPERLVATGLRCYRMNGIYVHLGSCGSCLRFGPVLRLNSVQARTCMSGHFDRRQPR
jgi:hypothetical protein